MKDPRLQPVAGEVDTNAESRHRARPEDKTVVDPAEVLAGETRLGSGSSPEPAATVLARPTPASGVQPRRLDTPGDVTGSFPAQAMSRLPSEGDWINQYELIRELGSGGMGTVFLARDTRLGRRVAIKFLHATHPELAERFVLEARATARCGHENIVVIHEVGEETGCPFMVLEYLQGTTLSGLIDGRPRMPAARVVELMSPVVRALVCAHEQGIVHRDLKPDNIFMTESGTIKVLDFGIAKVLSDDQRPVGAPGDLGAAVAEISAGPTNLTRKGRIMGTLTFMSPEQWGIGVDIDHRTDIWATGIILFRMLAGHYPLDPLEGHQLVVTAMLDRPMPSLRDAAPDVPAGLAETVDRCLLKDKALRFPDARSLLRALEEHMPGRFSGSTQIHIQHSPYAGLAAFQESDAARFFGRSREVAAMMTRIRDQPMMAVVGPSGAGKSSFVRAGLVPALKSSGETWEALVIRPGRDPLAALAALLTPMVKTSTSVVEDLDRQRAMTERLRAEPGYLGTVLRSRARIEESHILLFVDQFEELYTLVADPEIRRAFTACLAGVADDPTAPLRVMLSLRSDFLDRVPEDPRFMSELNQGLFFMTAPGRDGLREALMQPAEMAGYRFESAAMVEDMLTALETTTGALPLLQFGASKLWEMRDPDRKLITESSYHRIGGIVGALATHADSVMAELSSRAQALVRDIFLHLVTAERTRAIVSLSELSELSRSPDEVETLINHLAQARLLVIQTGGGGEGASVEIVHESLIHSWPMLQRWLDENQDDAVFLEQLRTAARQWQAKSYDSGLLWRGDTAAEARRWRSRYRGELPNLQQSFLDHVFAHIDLAGRRKRIAVAGSMVILVALVAAAAVALVIIRNSHKEAERQAAVAKVAEKQAVLRLEQVQEKERERSRAESLKQKAETGLVKANAEVDRTNEELERANAELRGALEEAESSSRRAKEARAEAEKNAARALDAQKDAYAAKERAETLLAREKERMKRQIEQLGSPIMDELK
jgi:serine/threonine protein kinase